MSEQYDTNDPNDPFDPNDPLNDPDGDICYGWNASGPDQELWEEWKASGNPKLVRLAKIDRAAIISIIHSFFDEEREGIPWGLVDFGWAPFAGEGDPTFEAYMKAREIWSAISQRLEEAAKE